MKKKLLLLWVSAFLAVLSSAQLPGFNKFEPKGAYVILDTFIVNDSDVGNNNGLAELGETFNLDLTLKNTGNAITSGNVIATISSTQLGNYVETITNNTCNFYVLAPENDNSSSSCYTVTLAEEIPDQTTIPFTVAITDGTSNWNASFQITVTTAEISISNYYITNDDDSNGNLDPGESGNIVFDITNTGSCVGTYSALLSETSDPDNYVALGTTSFTDISILPNATYSFSFNITASDLAPIATPIGLQLDVNVNSIIFESSNINLIIGEMPVYLISDQGTYEVCSGLFYDSGGETGQYSNSENYTITFLTPADKDFVIVDFISFNTESGYDSLMVYDGPNTSSNYIGKFMGTTSPGKLMGTNGLTFKFKTDGSGLRDGWIAEISCHTVTEAPDCATNPFPPNDTTNILPTQLSWDAVDWTSTYDVYIGIDDNPFNNTPVNVTSNSMNLTTELNSSYYWTVIPKNNIGDASGCETWSFQTIAALHVMSNTTIETCEGIFYDSGGPNGQYQNNQNITMTFLTPADKDYVVVDFISFVTENNYDSLMIYNGPSTSSPFIGKFMGTTSPGIVAGQNGLTFKFKTDGSGTRDGWAAIVSCYTANEVPSCVSNPSPANNSSDIFPLKLTWNSIFGVTSYDVYFGTDPNPLNNTPLNVTTNYLYISPESNSTYYWTVIAKNEIGDATGCDIWTFSTGEANYIMQNAIVETCEGIFYDSGGSTGQYQNNENYTITFLTPENQDYVIVDFSSFNTESSYDSLMIWDGQNTSSPFIGKYSGTTSPGIVAGQNGLTFRFKSNSSTTKAGWQAEVSCYAATEVPVCASTPTPANNASNIFPTILTWGSIFGATSYDVYFGTDTDPFMNTPQNVETNSLNVSLSSFTTYYWTVVPKNQIGDAIACEIWTFTTGDAILIMSNLVVETCEGKFYDTGGSTGQYQNYENITMTFLTPADKDYVVVDFVSFETESGYDSLMIYDGPNTSSPFIGKFMGTTSPGTIAGANGLTFKFKSDVSTTKSGWEANISCYTVTEIPECAANPIPANNTTEIFPTLLTWNSIFGATSYDVYFGTDANPLNNTPQNVTTNSLNILPEPFTTYYWTVIPKNQIGDAIGCDIWTFTTGETEYLISNSTIEVCEGTFYDTGGPDAQYQNSENITMTFLKPADKDFVIAEFTSFSTQSSYDSLMIWDGPSTSSPFIGKYSGTTSPGTIIGANGLTFRFKSSSSTTSDGWSALISCYTATEIPDCAQNPVPANSSTNIYSTQLSWNDVLWASSYDVYFGTDVNPLNNVPVTINDNFLEVETDFSTTYYWIVIPKNSVGDATGCEIWSFTIGAPVFYMSDETVTTCDGVFFDSGGPDDDYTNYEDFTMTFLPETPDAKLNFVFTVFVLELGSSGTQYDYLEVYDGSSTSASLIGKFCEDDGSIPTELQNLTATNEEGSLTFVFHSDGSTYDSGWSAIISCLESASYDVEFTVLDNASSLPIENAAVEVNSVIQNTNNEGITVFSLTNGDYSYNVSADTYESGGIQNFTVNSEPLQFEIRLDKIVSIENSEINFYIYPNPNNGKFNLITKDENSFVEIYDVTGKIIFSKLLSSITNEIDLSEYSKGIYLVKINSQHKIITKHLIIQ